MIKPSHIVMRSHERGVKDREHAAEPTSPVSVSRRLSPVSNCFQPGMLGDATDYASPDCPDPQLIRVCCWPTTGTRAASQMRSAPSRVSLLSRRKLHCPVEVDLHRKSGLAQGVRLV